MHPSFMYVYVYVNAYMYYAVCFILFFANSLPSAASVGSVNNFRIVSIGGQNVSFSWEVNNIPIDNISYFDIRHTTKVMGFNPGEIRIWVDETANSTNGQKLTFAHIIDVGGFGYLHQKIMSLQVTLNDNRMLESKQIYAETRELCLYFDRLSSTGISTNSIQTHS